MTVNFNKRHEPVSIVGAHWMEGFVACTSTLHACTFILLMTKRASQIAALKRKNETTKHTSRCEGKKV
jgi:hypothetical protein